MRLEKDMAFPVSETYGLSANAKSLVESVLTSHCETSYPVYMLMADTTSQRILIDKAFSIP